MVAMNTKDWQANVQVGIHVINHSMVRITMTKIDFGIRDDFNFHWSITENMFLEYFHALVLGKTRWFILMKQISSEQNKIHFFFFANFQNLIESDKGIQLSFGVLFAITKMIVSSNQDFYGVNVVFFAVFHFQTKNFDIFIFWWQKENVNKINTLSSFNIYKVEDFSKEMPKIVKKYSNISRENAVLLLFWLYRFDKIFSRKCQTSYEIEAKCEKSNENNK